MTDSYGEVEPPKSRSRYKWNMRDAHMNRADYAPDHAVRLSYDQHPTHIDLDGQYLWQIPLFVNETTTEFDVHMTKRSRQMEYINCDGCTRHHRVYSFYFNFLF